MLRVLTVLASAVSHTLIDISANKIINVCDAALARTVKTLTLNHTMRSVYIDIYSAFNISNAIFINMKYLLQIEILVLNVFMSIISFEQLGLGLLWIRFFYKRY